MIRPHALSRIAPAALVFAVSLALAQAAPPPPKGPPPLPPDLEPLPQIPPPPEIAADPDLEPQVTISRREGEVVEEARVGGKIAWIKVTPRHGKAYYLVPDGGANTYIRRDSLDSGLKVPMWVIFTF
jgi:hypothetical protein